MGCKKIQREKDVWVACSREREKKHIGELLHTPIAFGRPQYIPPLFQKNTSLNQPSCTRTERNKRILPHYTLTLAHALFSHLVVLPRFSLHRAAFSSARRPPSTPRSLSTCPRWITSAALLLYVFSSSSFIPTSACASMGQELL